MATDPNSIREALEALDELGPPVNGREYSTEFLPRIAIIRAALEAAEAERSAWEAIEAWQRLNPDILRIYWAHSAALGWVVEIGTDRHHMPRRFTSHAPTRLEALTAAADWCRKEMRDG